MFNSNVNIAYRKTAFAERWLHANKFTLRVQNCTLYSRKDKPRTRGIVWCKS